MRSLSLLASVLATASPAPCWSLSGTVFDGEDGSQVKNVAVSLAQGGLTDTTDSRGEWRLEGSIGVRPRRSASNGIDRSRSILDARIRLHLDGRDILGRESAGRPTPAGNPTASRAAGTVSDTLVYSKDGFVTKRVPLFASELTGIGDSLRRIRYEGWVDSSHANRKPDTLNAFTAKARTITFRWTKRNWDAMMKAMADSCGAFGTRGTNGTTSRLCSEGQNDYIEKSAMIWVPADIETDGQVWKNVGIRLKGNWSLQQAWISGNYALPFRFNTDKFEDSLPETKNQRFYGFRKISLYNALQDPSSIRGPVASSLFRQFGVPAPVSVPVHLVLKFGDTTKDVGAYEMVEVPDDPLLLREFGNDSGNLYKPLSKLDGFVESEWADSEIPGDRGDARALIQILNSTDRTADSAKWHRDLESVVDVDGFLRWLAMNTVVNGWDAYGIYPHNYYLFDDRGRFRWIPYDFGNSFNYTMGSRTSIWYDQSLGGDTGLYPLIRNLLADAGYCETYRSWATRALAGPAKVPNFQGLVDKYGAWVSSIQSTVQATSSLRTFMSGRAAEVQNSLDNKSCPIPIR